MKRSLSLFILIGSVWVGTVVWGDTFPSDSKLKGNPSSSTSRNERSRTGGIQGLEDPRKRKLGRKLSSIKRVPRPKSWFLGPALTFDGPLAKVDSGDTLSRGLGYGGGLSLSYRQTDIRFEFQTAYRYLRLARNLIDSGALVDPSASEFSQRVHYIGTGGWVSWLVEEGTHHEQGFEPYFWLDVGSEFLFPLSGKQTSSVVEDLKLQSQKLWWVLIGGTVDFELPREQMLQGRLHLFYNLPGNSQGRLFGVRAQIAFQFGLL